MAQTGQSASEKFILALSLLGIFAYLLLRYGLTIQDEIYTLTLNAALASELANLYQGQFYIHLSLIQIPLYLVLIFGGIPLILQIIRKFFLGDIGADLLAGLSIVTAVWLQEYLAACLVILMLASGVVLEAYAVKKASSVLAALAKRMPAIAHKKTDGLVT